MWRRHVVAAFVLYHCAAITLAALPSAGEGLDRKAWTDPTVQDEFRRWSGWLGVSSEQLQDRAYEGARDLSKARGVILRPFSAYLGFFGIKQSWKMFVAPHRYPTRFQLQSDDGSGWRTRFFEGDPDADWNGRAFAAEPYRGLLFRWGWTTYAGNYKYACRQLAGRMFAEEPDVASVRCRIYKFRSQSPDEARRGDPVKGSWSPPFLVKR